MSKDAKRPGQIILAWWGANLQPAPENETGGVLALRARLRRADRAVEVLSERKVITLFQDLPDYYSRYPQALIAFLPVLAWVKTNESVRIAQKFGGGDPPPLSKLRFQRLIRLDDPDELATALRRALPLIGHACNVAALGEDFLRWNDERTRTRWCFDYFGKMPPDTSASIPKTEKTA